MSKAEEIKQYMNDVVIPLTRLLNRGYKCEDDKLAINVLELFIKCSRFLHLLTLGDKTYINFGLEVLCAKDRLRELNGENKLHIAAIDHECLWNSEPELRNFFCIYKE